MNAPRRPSPLNTALAAALLALLAACTQTSSGPQCRLDRDCGEDQVCTDGSCQNKDVCSSDADCEVEQRCDALSGACLFRAGFGTQCGPNNANGVCAVGQFCALGKCRDTATAVQCARRLQCPVGFVCDRQSFYCIEEADCSLATDPERPYPELTCDPGERCDDNTGVCVGTGPAECTPGEVPSDCAPTEKCNGAGRCVQCISNVDCGAGLRCNTRAGLCESTSACRSDSDCRAPLVCDRVTAVCVVPQPPCQSDFDCQLGEFCDSSLGTCQAVEGPCQDDRLEQNDSAPDAQPVALMSGMQELDDLQLCPNDADTFGVPLEAGDALTAVVLGARASARVELTAVAPDGLTTLRFVEAPPRGNGTVSFVAQAAGTHYVRAYSAAGQTAYALQLTRSFVGSCNPDLLEPNADAFAATRLMAGQTNLTLCPGDADWFALPAVLPGQTYVVTMVGPTDEQMDMRITDAFGTRVLARSTLPGSNHTLRYRVEVNEPLLLAVTPFAGGTGPYLLTLSVLTSYVCSADALEAPAALPDGGVPVSSSSSAEVSSSSLPPSSSVESSSAASASAASSSTASSSTAPSSTEPFSGSGSASAPGTSVDVSSGAAPSSAGASGGVSEASSQGSASSGLAESGSQGAASSVDVSSSGMASSSVEAASSGVASSAGASSADSSISSASSAEPGSSSMGAMGGGPQVAGNNTQDTATPVFLEGLEADLSVCLGDEDWFRVEARAHQRVVVTASWELGRQGVAVEAYNSAGDLLGRAAGVALSALTAPGNAAGAVFVRVVAPNTESPYHLSIQVERNDVCLPDSAEFNNTGATAGLAPAEGVFTLCDGDIDLFRVEAVGGVRLQATLDFSTADGDLDLAVFLPDGVTPLQTSDGVTGSEVVDVALPADPPAGGAYFVAVYSPRSGTTARYVLTTLVVNP